MIFPALPIAITAIFLFTPEVFGEDYRAQIITAAETFLDSKAQQAAIEWNASSYKVRVKPLSENVRLPACKSEIRIADFRQNPYGEQTLQAICTDTWKILIKGRIQLFLPIIVSRTRIPARKQLKDQDIEWQARDISKDSDYLTQVHQAVDHYARKAIKPGTTLNNQLLSVSSP